MSRPSASPTAASLVLAAAALLCLAACGGASAPDGLPADAFANTAADVAYVGDAACASCHEDLYASYQTHGMAHSLYAWRDSLRVEPTTDAPLVHAATGYAYAVVEGPDGLYQEETRPAADGGPAHRLRRRMDVVVGSGSAARTYFAEQNGRLYQLPLTWYTQDGRWAFSPGYEAANARFGRLMPDRCMACHNGVPDAVPRADGVFASWPEGIGCERCHGPGALHVAARREDPEPPEGGDRTIVNPAHLPLGRRLDVCQQCHLHTTVSVLREGRGAFDFRPGEALSSHVAFFSAQDEPAGVPVISHADRMQRSACFTATRAAARPLECTTCHDPHAGFRDRGPAYFTAACLTCHAPDALQAAVPPAARTDHAAAADCAGCHMPAVAAEDAPHASFTDHWIRVVGRDEDAPPPPARRLAAYYEADRDTPDGMRYEALAMVTHGTQTGDAAMVGAGARYLAQTLADDTTHAEALFLLGAAQQHLGRPDAAVAPLERAVRQDPDDPQRLYALAQAYAATGRPADAVERLYRRALAVQPRLAWVRRDYGRFLLAEGRAKDALAAFDAAATENPWLDGLALARALALLQLGRRTDADAALADAVALDPDAASVTLWRVDAGGGWTPVPGMAGPGPVRAAAGGGALQMEAGPPGAARRVYTADGRLVRTLRPGEAWDGRDGDGRPAGTGVYVLQAGARPVGTLGLLRVEGGSGAPSAPGETPGISP